MNPVLYGKDETNFNHLGLGVLKDAVSCFVTEELNGVFEMELVYPSTGVHAELLDVDLLIKVDAGHASFSKDQRFRIERVDKDIDGMIRVFGRHVSYLAGSLVLQPNVEIHDVGAEGALRLWSQSIVEDHPFSVGSNITGRRSATLSVNQHPNARVALGGVRGSILDVWGGEFIFDNYRVDLRAERGGRANTLISYGRNLTDLNQEENIANTFTSVYPYAVVRDGDNEEIITIPEFVVDSEHAGSFAHRRVLPIDFSREFERDERLTANRLRDLALAYIEANDIGIPKVSISLSFVDLSKTLNASGIPYEEIGLGDMIPVKFEKLGVETVAKVVRVQWNVLLGQYESLDVGAMRQTLGDTVRNVQREVNEVSNRTSSGVESSMGFSPVRLEVDRIDTTTMFTGTINASFVNAFGVNATRLSAGNSHLTHDVNGRLRITSDVAGSNTQAIHTNGMIVGAWNMGGAAAPNVNRTTYANGWCGTVGNFNFNIARNNTNRILIQEHTTAIRAGNNSGNTSRTTVYLDHRGNSPTWLGIGQSGTDVAFSQRTYVRSPAIYSRTSTASSNWLRTTAYGTINRVTSAKRYKLNVQKEEDLDFAKRLLNVSPASWFDRYNTEAYASMITSSMDSRGRVDWKKVEEKAKEEVEPITRIGGLIAEDVEEAGLNMYVSYGADGKTIEGVQYDRLWTLLIPLVREQQKQISDLTQRLETLENLVIKG